MSRIGKDQMDAVDSPLLLSLTCTMTRSFGTPMSSWCFVSPPQLAQLLWLEQKAHWVRRQGLRDQVTIRTIQQSKPYKRIQSAQVQRSFLHIDAEVL